MPRYTPTAALNTAEQLLESFVSIMDAATEQDGVCVTDLEELALEVRAYRFAQKIDRALKEKP